jgi:hypothetical protein
VVTGALSGITKYKCRPTTHFLHKVRSPSLLQVCTTSGVNDGFEGGGCGTSRKEAERKLDDSDQ